MALDRRITVSFEGPGGGRDMHGEYHSWAYRNRSSLGNPP